MKKIMTILAIALLVSVCCIACDNEKNSKVPEQNVLETDNDSGNSDSKAEEQEVSIVEKTITSESSWSYNVTDPVKVYEHSDYFLKIYVKSKNETKYFIENAIMPSSTYSVEVLEVLENEDGTIPKNIKLAMSGGIVTMQDYINTMDEETKSKINADKLTTKELEESVLIKDDSYYELGQGKEYYVFVRDLTNDENYKGYYGMPDGGYDVFEEINGEYVNVLTREVWKKL